MSRRVALSIAFGLTGALALVALYAGVVTWAQGSDHALELLWTDRLFVGFISAGFATQVGLLTYVRLLQRGISRETVALTGAGTTASSVSMVACCAHHVADFLPIVGVSGLAAFLVDFRTPLMLVGLGTNAIGIVVMSRTLLRMTARYRRVARYPATAA